MRKYFSLVKFPHTIFALPFALVGYVLGLNQPGVGFDPLVLVLIILCMVFARNAAMAFNRYKDRDIDALNLRTRNREIPAGVISARSALVFTVINSVLFILTTYFINPLCFYLSPVALLVILGYSFTKRFTALSHFILGIGLSLAPIGAYLAVTEVFDLIPVLIGAMVLLWVGGFDIIYALQDEEFDAEQKLHSIPAAMGKRRAIILSTVVHIICGLICLYVVRDISQNFDQAGVLLWLGAGVFIISLIYQHLIVKADDLSRVNLAFFTTNGIASLVFGASVILDFYI
jgi:4-hydroxybenzoate polyprenyltransferase